MALDPWSYAEKTRTEHAEQVALFMWANMAYLFGVEAANDPASYVAPGYAMRRWGAGYDGNKPKRGPKAVDALKWLHAIKNQRDGDNRAAGAKAKAEGVKPGVFDVFLPVPTSQFVERLGAIRLAGFYIELKRKDTGRPSPEQLVFQTDMQAAGYRAEIIHGWELARDAICAYLNLVH